MSPVYCRLVLPCVSGILNCCTAFQIRSLSLSHPCPVILRRLKPQSCWNRTLVIVYQQSAPTGLLEKWLMSVYRMPAYRIKCCTPADARGGSILIGPKVMIPFLTAVLRVVADAWFDFDLNKLKVDLLFVSVGVRVDSTRGVHQIQVSGFQVCPVSTHTHTNN